MKQVLLLVFLLKLSTYSCAQYKKQYIDTCVYKLDTNSTKIFKEDNKHKVNVWINLLISSDSLISQHFFVEKDKPNDNFYLKHYLVYTSRPIKFFEDSATIKNLRDYESIDLGKKTTKKLNLYIFTSRIIKKIMPYPVEYKNNSYSGNSANYFNLTIVSRDPKFHFWGFSHSWDIVKKTNYLKQYIHIRRYKRLLHILNLSVEQIRKERLREGELCK